jgi:hypothetical protein
LTDRRTLYAVTLLAALVSAAALGFFHWHGSILHFGDAAAHLNIARRLVDTKTPGWEQIGTVWLPLPHLLAAPLVAWDPLWRSGIGGAIPSLLAFVAGAVFLFRIAREGFGEPAPAWCALVIYLTNVNLLYLQATPMNETQALAAFLAAVYFAQRQRPVAAGVAVLIGTLIRYDAWFTIPFFALFFWRRIGWRCAAVFAGIAALGPLLWLAHNQWLYGNALEWYNGPYSAQAIAERSRVAGQPRHPGDHHPGVAFLYYSKACQLAIGGVPLFLAAVGMAGLTLRRRLRLFLPFDFCLLPFAFLFLPLLFYAASIAYGGVPLFHPAWWPFSYYNTRYAVQMLPAAAVLAPAALLWLPRWRRQAALALALAVAGGWTLGVSRAGSDGVVVLREAELNSLDRRYGVELLARELKRGCGEIWIAAGDWAGAFPAAGIPFARAVHEGNHYQWRLAARRADLMVDCVVAQEGDAVTAAIARQPQFATSFVTALDLVTPGKGRVRVYRRK